MPYSHWAVADVEAKSDSANPTLQYILPSLGLLLACKRDSPHLETVPDSQAKRVSPQEGTDPAFCLSQLFFNFCRHIRWHFIIVVEEHRIVGPALRE